MSRLPPTSPRPLQVPFAVEKRAGWATILSKRWWRRRTAQDDGAQSVFRSRLLVGTVAASVAAVLVLAAVRYVQMARIGRLWLDEARAHTQAGDAPFALRRYSEYLAWFPGDRQAMVELARLQAASATTRAERRQALRAYTQALALPPPAPSDVHLLQAEVAELAWRNGEFHAAIENADAALLKSPDDPKLWQLIALGNSALAERNRLKLPVAVEALRRANRLAPSDLTVAATLARDLRGLDSHAESALVGEADRALDTLVELKSEDPQAWLARYVYRSHFLVGDFQADLDKALELAPDDLEILVSAAQQARHDGDAARAVELYRRATELVPPSARPYMGLAWTLRDLGQAADAEAALEEGSAKFPNDPWLNLQLAEYRLMAGDPAATEARLGTVAHWMRVSRERLPPAHRSAIDRLIRYLRGCLELGRGHLDEAIAIFEPLLAETELVGDPQEDLRRVQLRYALAECLTKRGDYMSRRQAALYLDDAAEIQPNVAAHLVNAGRAWEAALRPEWALRRYERAMGLDPERVELQADVSRARAKLAAPKP